MKDGQKSRVDNELSIISMGIIISEAIAEAHNNNGYNNNGNNLREKFLFFILDGNISKRNDKNP